MRVVTSGVDALPFRDESQDDLAAAVTTFLNDAALRGRYGNAAHARLLAGGYTWDTNAERIEEQWELTQRPGAHNETG